MSVMSSHGPLATVRQKATSGTSGIKRKDIIALGEAAGMAQAISPERGSEYLGQVN